MFSEMILAVLQAATEFLPVSSSGHLALISNIIDKPNLFFFAVLHLSSLLAVLIFTRREIYGLLSFNKGYRKLWIYLAIATLPAVLFGFFFKDVIEKMFSSFLFLGIAFFFTGFILFFTQFSRAGGGLNWKKSLFVGLFQALALFPGVSRSGMTISSGLFSGIEKEKAVKFSFLLFIPLSLGAFLLEIGEFYISWGLIISFFVCFFLSLLFLNLLTLIVEKDKFWIFGVYCWMVGLISLILYFLS